VPKIQSTEWGWNTPLVARASAPEVRSAARLARGWEPRRGRCRRFQRCSRACSCPSFIRPVPLQMMRVQNFVLGSTNIICEFSCYYCLLLFGHFAPSSVMKEPSREPPAIGGWARLPVCPTFTTYDENCSLPSLLTRSRRQ
jgi:hypothetical protein